MADVTPNYGIERKKVEVQIGQLRQNVLAQELREMQLQADLAQIRNGIKATENAIAEQERVLGTLHAPEPEPEPADASHEDPAPAPNEATPSA